LFYPRDAMRSVVCAVAKCLFVRPSRSDIFIFPGSVKKTKRIVEIILSPYSRVV